MLSALVIIVVLAIIGGTMVASVDLHSKSTRNETETIRLQQVADAGLAHAIALLHDQVAEDPLNAMIRGVDGSYGTADDGLFVGMGIPTSDQIPAAGVLFGTDRYFVTISDDPADDNKLDTDKNNQVMLTCRAVAPSGTSLEVRAIVARDPLPSQALALGGDVSITNKFTFNGNCGSVHVNGQLSGTANANAVKGWSHTSSVAVPSSFVGSPKTANAAVISIQSVTYAQACPAGMAATRLSGDQTLTMSSLSGVYCVDGNVSLSGSTSTVRTASVIASGSIRTNAGSAVKLKNAHPAGYVMVAGGDLQLITDTDLTGMVRCGGQLDFAGKVNINGTTSCLGNPSHPGLNWESAHVIASDGKITNACGSAPGVLGEWVQIGWYPIRGS